MKKDIATLAIAELQKLKEKNVIQNSILSDELDNVINRLNDKSFRLAVVGEFSSGKSTFLNAVLKKDLLKHGTVETTATLTQIDNISSDEDDQTFDVLYVDGRKEANIPIERLEDYTSTSSKIVSVADEVKKVILKTHIFDVDYPISLIDTPGLNGIADNHREKTIDEIKNAHACIYLMQVRGINKADAEFIRYLCDYQKNILFVQNFIDELHELEGESPEQKIAAQRKILEEDIFYDKPDVHYDIIGVSARNALIAQDKETFSKYSDAERAELLASSNFKNLIAKIQELITENLTAKKQQKDAIRVALRILDQMHDIANIQIERQKQDDIESGKQGKVRYYTLLEERLQKNKEKYQKNIRNYISVETTELHKISNKKIEEDLERFSEHIEDTLNKIKFIDEMEDFVYDGGMSRQITSSVYEITQGINTLINYGLENIQDGAMLRIEEYLGSSKVSVNKKWNKVTIIEEGYRDFITERDKIIELQEDEVKELEKKKDENSKKISELERENGDNFKLLNSVRLQLDNNESERSSEIRRLGSMPDVEKQTIYEDVEEYRGGLGILDAVLGPKIVTKERIVDDYSLQNKWKNKKNIISEKYNNKAADLKENIDALSSKIEFLNSRIKELDENNIELRLRISEQLDEINMRQSLIEKEKNVARLEYLRNLRKEALKSLENYLFEHSGVQSELEEKVSKVISREGKQIEIRSIGLFERNFRDRLESIRNSIKDSTQDKDTLNINREAIEKTMKNLEKLV
ncbi:hypothetical protein FAX13_08525 [Ligilactobacillus animalis]|nr:hypothetical protein FAX13_08525 [Ligilactobacillus animalis]